MKVPKEPEMNGKLSTTRSHAKKEFSASPNASSRAVVGSGKTVGVMVKVSSF